MMEVYDKNGTKINLQEYEDSGWQEATLNEETTTGSVRYRVINGICYVNYTIRVTTTAWFQAIAKGMPKSKWEVRTISKNDQGTYLAFLFNTTGSLINAFGVVTDQSAYGAFSYPVD